MDINKYVGNKIREFRQRKNITQEELAEYLNTTGQTISRYEIGDRKTNQDVLFALADYFHVSIDDFFPKRDLRNNNELDNLLFSKAKSLTDDEKKAVLQVMNAIHKDIDKELDK